MPYDTKLQRQQLYNKYSVIANAVDTTSQNSMEKKIYSSKTDHIT